jgi:glutaredoxin 3
MFFRVTVPITIYSTRHCGYCLAAAALLRELAIAYHVIDVTGDAHARRALIERAQGRRTVPVIFAGDQLIGGFRELAELARTGKLHSRIQSAQRAND